MPYSSPVSSEADRALVGLDKVLSELRDSFNEIEWLEGKIHLRAYTDTFPEVYGDPVTSPMIYMGNSEYHDASINDHLNCSMFFQARGSEKVTFEKPRDRKTISHRRSIALVFWCNLQRLAEDFSADYIYTEQIKPFLMQRLAKSTHVVSIEEYTDEPIQAVFEGFTFLQGRQYNKYPFAGIRIEFTVEWKSNVNPC